MSSNFSILKGNGNNVNQGSGSIINESNSNNNYSSSTEIIEALTELKEKLIGNKYAEAIVKDIDSLNQDLIEDNPEKKKNVITRIKELLKNPVISGFVSNVTSDLLIKSLKL